jgi:hypothetical protein
MSTVQENPSLQSAAAPHPPAPPDPDALLVPVVPLDADAPPDPDALLVPVVPLDAVLTPEPEVLSELSKRPSSVPPQAAGAPAARAPSKRTKGNRL